jgi:hypothetical protein
MDDRLNIQKNTKDNLIIRMLFDDELPNYPKDSNRANAIEIAPYEKKVIGIFDDWEGQFDRALPNESINIIVMQNFDYYSNQKKWDSLVKEKAYNLKNIV